MKGREGRRNNDEAGIRAVELQPDFNTIQVCVIENITDIEVFTKCSNIHDVYETDTRVPVVLRWPRGCTRAGRRSGIAQHRIGGAKRAETWRGSVK